MMHLMEIGATYTTLKSRCSVWHSRFLGQDGNIEHDFLFKNDLMFVVNIVDCEDEHDFTVDMNIVQVLTRHGVRYIHDEYDVKKV